MNKETKNCYWHKWNKWEDINIISSEHINISQIKSCQKCNKKKGRSITYVRKVR